MNYYYDIILNWSDEAAYEFYEWYDTDYLELVKKIPLFKVKHKTFLDLSQYNIKVDDEFLNIIKDKTLISGKNIINKINYAALFTDNKNVIAIEFNSSGESISHSKLLLDDELNVLEATYNLKDLLFTYEIKEAIEYNYNLRQVNDAKKLINLEINSLYEKKDLSKLKYLYYEYKQEQEEDIEVIYHDLLKDVETNFNQNILKLYYIIKLSYHNV